MLLKKIQCAHSYDSFYKENQTSLKDKNYVAVWKDVLKDIKIKKADVIAKANIGYTYFYDIMRGEKHPSRDTLIKLCLAIGLKLDDCQKILYTYDWAYLYADVARDSVFIFAVNNSLSIEQTNILLEKYNLKLLKL